MVWVALFYTLCVFFQTTLSADFLIYAPTNSASYTGAIASLGKSYTTVSAAQFSSMSTNDFKQHGAIVFADPNCATSQSGYLPTTNLAAMYAAVTGNVIIIGTDEKYHWGQGGSTMATSGLAYVIGEPGATGLYVSFSCYYYAASAQAVPFLAPLTTTKAFMTKAAPDCFNQAHIVAKSPALNGLTDASMSNWSCSVHEVFYSWPPEFLPLAIARNIPTSDTVTFGDGSVGIPYILARGKTLAPIACGDKIVQTGEECDSGPSCTNCKCDAGSTAYSPPQTGCKSTDFCATYGYSGKPDNAKSCTNGVNSRTITCNDGYAAVGGTFDSPTVTLTPGEATFGGCTVKNFCTVYGYSGRPDHAISCVSTSGGRTITCAPGYYAGGSPADNPVVSLAGSAVFAGCSVIDNCGMYGYSGKPTGAKQCINAVNTRTIVCSDGYYAVAPSTPSVTLVGSAAFAGCTPIDMCGVYGYSGKTAFTLSCTSTTNTRTITCQPGYYAKASTDQGTADNDKQRDNAIASITLTGSAAFEGCAEIDKCKFIGCKDVVSSQTTTCRQIDGSNSRVCTCPSGYYPVAGKAPEPSVTVVGVAAFTGCTPIKACALYGTPAHSTCADTAPNTRTITCDPGYYAIAPTTRTIVVVADAPFAGCKDIAECTVYGPPAPDAKTFVAKCEERTINTRTVTCLPGYYAAAPTTAEVTLEGSSSFAAGCTEIDECVVYKYSGKVDNTESCVDGINERTITCAPGYYAISPSTRSIKLTGSAAFAGCSTVDMCAVYGWGGKDNVDKCTNSGVYERTITCKAGYYAVGPSTASVVLKGDAAFGGCSVIDMCAVYGFSGKTDHTLSCVNKGVNVRTITCAVGYHPIGFSKTSDTVDLTGPVAFAGCDETNQCTEYGYSGKPEGTLSCTSTVASRTVTCLPGYYITGTPMALPLTMSVTLGNAGVFVGCSDADECTLYGYSGKTNNTKSCTNKINSRTIECNTGYYATAPTSPTVTLVGAAAFAGCSDIDECAAYGFSGKDAFTLSCNNTAINERAVTCKPGYSAVAPDVPTEVLHGSANFTGCTLIDTCDLYRYSGLVAHTVSCVSGINNRTITCKDGYYATAPKDPKVTLIGKDAFKGCTRTDMCATQNNGDHVANCTNSDVNERTITCASGYFAVAPATPSTVVKGPVDWNDCKDIAECAVYACVDKKNNQTTNCTDTTPVDSRTCTCPTGWVANGTMASIVLTGKTVFAGCSEKCGDGLKVGIEGCDDGNTFAGDGCSPTCTVERGWRCPTPGSPCETICGDGILINGTEICDDGNLEDLDGCTSKCQIEEGWSCMAPGAPCTIIPLCALLGYDGKPENTLSCVNGVNTRTITCMPGYYAIAPYTPVVVLVGRTSVFGGCHYPVCGNGIIEGYEQCDDGNTVSKDGCTDSCSIEKNYVCTDPGFLCCYDPKIISADPLVCKEGWLVSPTADPVTVLTSVSQRDLPDLRICGDVVLVDQEVSVHGDWTIDGTLTLTRSTLSFAPTVEDSHVQLTHDDRCPLKTVFEEKDIQLLIDDKSTVKLTGLKWTDAEKEVIPAVISAEQNTHMDGQLVVQAEDIPAGSNPFDLIVSNNTAYGEPVAGESDLPGKCSNIAVEKQDSKVVGYTNRKDLCTGHIVAIAVGAALAALAALLLLLLLLLGSPLSTTTYDYTAL